MERPSKVHFDELIIERPLESLNGWCVASLFSPTITPQHVKEFLMRVLFDVKFGEHFNDPSTLQRKAPLIEAGIEAMAGQGLKSKMREVSETACYAVLCVERGLNQPEQHRWLEMPIKGERPRESEPGLDVLYIEYSSKGPESDKMMVGEIKSTSENKDVEEDDRFKRLDAQVKKILKRFTDQVPEILFYRLDRFADQHFSCAKDKARIVKFWSKYDERETGVSILSFLVFDLSWIEEPEKVVHVEESIRKLEALTREWKWSREQNLLMVFPLRDFPTSLDSLYTTLSRIKDEWLQIPT